MKLSKSLVLACIAGGVGVCTAPALAQVVGPIDDRQPSAQPQIQPLDVGKFVEPIAVARARLIEGKVVVVGPWITYEGGMGATDFPDTVYFDSFEADSTGAPTGFCDVTCTQLGSCPGAAASNRWWLGPTYTNAFSTRDMTILAGAEGEPATGVRFAWGWGPTVATDCYVAIFTHETFNDCTAGPPGATGDFDGIIYFFGQQTGGAGYFRTEVEPPAGLYHEMPADGQGAYTIAIGNEVDPATGEMTLDFSPGTQPMLWGTGNNNDPVQPERVGEQGDFGWDDDDPADGEHTSNECYDQNVALDLCPNPLGNMIMFLGDPISTEPGACCLPDGTCDEMLLRDCRNADGLFQGENTTCADPGLFCRQPGACCLLDGSCVVTAQHVCERDNGTYQGDGSDCLTTNCPAPGACCFTDGSCVVASESQCTTAGGNYNGDGTLCGPVSCSQEPMLLKNGPLSTGDMHSQFVEAPPGTEWSELQDEVLCPATIFGFAITGASRIADNFIVPGNDGWIIESVDVFAYQTQPEGATHPPVPSPFTGATIRVWDGPPNDPASNVIWGDTSTNRLIDTEFADLYRIGRTADPQQNLRRPIYRNEIQVNRHFSPGQYWLDVSLQVADGAAFAPPVTLIGARGFDGANALQQGMGGSWSHMIDPSIDPFCTPRRQELAFIIWGEEGEADCYANCDGSTSEPILTVDDFTCFINEFAEAQGLPVAQQIVHYANCDGSTTEPILTVDDFTCFINAFAEGCP